jgi:hypothetical protein
LIFGDPRSKKKADPAALYLIQNSRIPRFFLTSRCVIW